MMYEWEFKEEWYASDEDDEDEEEEEKGDR